MATLIPLTAVADKWQDPKTKVNYTYTVGKSEASVRCYGRYVSGSPDAAGAIAILSSFTVDGNEYTVTSIGDYAFYDCKNLTSVSIPSSVTSIGNETFFGCKGLTSVTISEGVTSIGNYAFKSCTSLKSVTIPSSVSSIGEYAFGGCNSLNSATISEGVTSIGDQAFSGCKSLTSVTIPSSMISIGSFAFHETPWYDKYYSAASNGLFCIGDILFGYKGNKPTGDVTIKDGTRIIAGSAFSTCSYLSSVTIPAGVVSIGNQAFYNCHGLNSLTIPAGVINIGNSAFYNCQSLTSVTIPAGVISIGMHAFDGIDGLTSVTLPSSLTSIGLYAFQCCNLTSVVSLIKEPFNIDSETFAHSYSSATLYVPQGTKEKYQATYAWNQFKTIVELDDDSSGVDAIAHDEGTVTERYAISGQRMSAGQRGLNIVRMSDGTVRKVQVK